MKEFKQVVKKLDDSKFKKLKGDFSTKYDIMIQNLHGMFNFEERIKSPDAVINKLQNKPPLDIRDYAWTKEVHEAFESHPYHKKYIEEFNKSGWVNVMLYTLNGQPTHYDPDKEKKK